MSAQTKRLGQLWLLIVAVVLAATLACAGDPSGQGAPGSAPAILAPAPSSSYKSGMSPLPGDLRVPAAELPPGAFDPDNGPSDVVFPQQQIMLRFNHKFHIGQGATCKTCHPGAYTSQSSADRLIPPGTTCDACHLTDHSNLAKVTPGDDESGQCAFCHVGWEKAIPMIRSNFPRANMVFNHQKHTSRNINCQQCHGAVQDLELATRDQLPRMRGCFKCHQMTDSAARGTAKSDCTTCHVRSEARDANAGACAPCSPAVK